MRHGITTFNLEKRVQGHCDLSSLAPEGQEAARQVGASLRGIRIDAAYSSPLKRARETADLILSMQDDSCRPASGLVLTDDLKEINLYLWEGMTFDEVKQNYPEAHDAWRNRPDELVMDIPTPDGGTIAFYPVLDLFEQAKRLWQAVLTQHHGQTVLLVAHSGINRALISSAIGIPAARYHLIHQTNCGISVLNFAGALGDPVQVESMNLTSHLGQPLPEMRSDHRGPRLLLVRHGETEWNRQKKFQGQIDVPLNDNGRIQSDKAAHFLKDIALHRAVSSPMLRPKETAEIILKHHPNVTLELMDDLQEISHGLWEGKLEGEIEASYPGMLTQWQQHPETVQMPEGENLGQVWERAIAAWEAIVASTPLTGETPPVVLVVAHDAINKAILCHVLGFGPEAFWAFKQGNGAVSVIDYPTGAGSRPLVQSLNITAHLGGVLDRTAAGAL